MKIKRIGLLTSGGDAPGMNAAIRAVVRTCIYHNVTPIGIIHGYKGLINNEVFEMSARSVSGIINRGGTILKSARCEEFYSKEGRALAYKTIKKHKIDGLITIGGDGTYHGAYLLGQEFGVRCIGIPGTIDNDIAGCDYTIGFDTAINVAMEAVDRIRDTAASHDRLFVIEVMGRHAGFIALSVALAGGAEAVLIPETKTDIDNVAKLLSEGRKKGKLSSIVIVAEGDEAGGAFVVAKQLEHKTKYETKVTILGHLQRGGSPTARDRNIASQLAYTSVKLLLQGKHGIHVVIKGMDIRYYPFPYAWEKRKKIDLSYEELIYILSI